MRPLMIALLVAALFAGCKKEETRDYAYAVDCYDCSVKVNSYRSSVQQFDLHGTMVINDVDTMRLPEQWRASANTTAYPKHTIHVFNRSLYGDTVRISLAVDGTIVRSAMTTIVDRNGIGVEY